MLRIPPVFDAIILAAGMSSRMGSPKATLRIDATPLIAHLVGTVSQSRCRRIIVVTGHEPQRIRSALEGHAVTFAHNAAWEAGGMLSSVKTGAAAVAPGCDAFFLMLLDQPLVRSSTLLAMIERWERRPAMLTVPGFSGKNGHPILISASGAAEILALAADATLRDFVDRHRAEMQLVDVDDPGVATDLDTPADFEALVELWRASDQGGESSNAT